MASADPMYVNISSDVDSVTKIESLCMNCHENGETMIMMTMIPFFKEMIVMSFRCDACGHRNNELQSGGKVELNGVRCIAIVDGARDLNRQVVKSEHCTVKIPELGFEIPPETQKGSLTTIEGLVMKSSADLKMTAELNKEANPEWAAQILEFCVEKLEKITEGKFNLILDDPSGYSTVENLHLPYPDPKLEIRHYGRTREQDNALGFYTKEEQAETFGDETDNLKGGNLDLTNEVLEFNERCISCKGHVVCRMKLVQIPFFKEITIMAVNCDHCGNRSNEVKAGGGISPKGKRLELKVSTPEDMARDILKSETANIRIPELDWDIGMGCIAGKFTTVEGLLNDLRTDLIDKNPFSTGDSSIHEGRNKRFAEFRERISDMIELKTEFTIILDDPAGNSYILSLCAPEPDPQLLEEEYERSWDQNEDLGINDMVLDNYGPGETQAPHSRPKKPKFDDLVEENEEQTMT